MASRFLLRNILFALSVAAALCAPARAQLDLGSPEIPQAEIDAYMRPFYRLVSAAIGSDRFAPAPASGRFAWHAGLDGVLVPLPDGDPFDRADLAALPLFRVGAGAGLFGAGVSARGLVWRDPRVGDLATYGADLAYGRALPGSLPLCASLLGAWDRLAFSSEYTYHYRGSPLGLADKDVPGDYTLSENLLALGLGLSFLRGPWGAEARASWEWTTGRFRYLYFDPSSDTRKTVVSRLEVPGPRFSLGASWRGFRVEMGMRAYPYAALGWAWIR